jgi:hypothetical protein
MNYDTEYADFYKILPVFDGEVGDLMTKEDFFKAVPQSWHVIVTDIKNSTDAVTGGKHDVVNYLATGSIVTVLNVVYSLSVDIPFFFGGDGATFLVPGSVLREVMNALGSYSANALRTAGLELRVGTVPVNAISGNGCQLTIAKYNSSEAFVIPIVIGDGLSYAEKLVKAPGYHYKFDETITALPDLSGMQCRWDQIPPPQRHEEVVTLLISSRIPDRQRGSFKRIIDHIDRVYGFPRERQPISVAKLRLKTTFQCVRLESKVFAKHSRFLSYISSMADKILTRFYFKTSGGKRYLESLVALSDTFVIDGRINTVISGTKRQRQRLEELLTKLEANGLIWYGMHISQASVMSCYVRNLEKGHIHFVDGADGGYTNAARCMKNKIRANRVDG